MKIKTILNIGVIATFLIVVGTIALMAARGPGDPVVKRGLPLLGAVPDFEFTEASGRPLRRADLMDKVWVASFIFTRCAEICPAMMRAEAALLARLPSRDDLRLVTFSVDPEHDQPPVLEQYAGIFTSNRRQWWFATGDKKKMFRLVMDGFKLSVEDAQPEEEMPILHSTKLVLVDRHGMIRGYYDSGETAEMDRLRNDIRRLLAARS